MLKPLACFPLMLWMALSFNANCCGEDAAAKVARPNVLFVMSDDHTTQAIGAYGSRLAVLNPTPTIDRLATEGMRFDNVVCTNSICVPSRASIMTGQYPHMVGCHTLWAEYLPSGSIWPMR